MPSKYSKSNLVEDVQVNICLYKLWEYLKKSLLGEPG